MDDEQSATCIAPIPRLDDLVVNPSHVYVKTPEALEHLFIRLREVGYVISDTRSDKHRAERKITVERMELEGMYLWYASIDHTRGKCFMCGRHISRAGIKMHGHKCEYCGAVVYYEIIDGTKVRLQFASESGPNYDWADMSVRARRWDAEQGYLYFYPEVTEGNSLDAKGSAEAHLARHRDKWEEVVEDGQRLIRVKHILDRSWPPKHEAVVHIRDVHGSLILHSEVLVWNGKEGKQLAGISIPESFHIYEVWRSPSLKERFQNAVSDPRALAKLVEALRPRD